MGLNSRRSDLQEDEVFTFYLPVTNKADNVDAILFGLKSENNSIANEAGDENMEYFTVKNIGKQTMLRESTAQELSFEWKEWVNHWMKENKKN